MKQSEVSASHSMEGQWSTKELSFDHALSLLPTLSIEILRRFMLLVPEIVPTKQNLRLSKWFMRTLFSPLKGMLGYAFSN